MTTKFPRFVIEGKDGMGRFDYGFKSTEKAAVEMAKTLTWMHGRVMDRWTGRMVWDMDNAD